MPCHRQTTAYDEIVKAEDLPRILPKLQADEQNGYDEAVRLIDAGFQPERMIVAQHAGQLASKLAGALPIDFRRKAVVSFLIDHSGSMKGLRMVLRFLPLMRPWMP